MKLLLVKTFPQCQYAGCFKNADYCVEVLHKQYFCQEHTDKATSLFTSMTDDKPTLKVQKLVTNLKYSSLPSLEEALNRTFLLTCQPGAVLYAKRIQGRFSKDSLATTRGSYIDNLPAEFEEVGQVSHLIKLLDIAQGSIPRLIEAFNATIV